MTQELPEEMRGSILARIPQGRMGRADEIADVVAFLATRASYINGTVIHVNGGMFGGERIPECRSTSCGAKELIDT